MHLSLPRGIACGVIRRPGCGMLSYIRPCRRGFTRFQNRKALAGICLRSPAAPLPVSEYFACPTLLPTLIHTRSSAWIPDTTTAPGCVRTAATESRCSAVAGVWETRQGEPAQAWKRRPGNLGNGAEERDKAEAAQEECGTRPCVMEAAAPGRGRSHPEAPAQQVREAGARPARGTVGPQPHQALPRRAAREERQAAAGGRSRHIFSRVLRQLKKVESHSPVLGSGWAQARGPLPRGFGTRPLGGLSAALRGRAARAGPCRIDPPSQLIRQPMLPTQDRDVPIQPARTPQGPVVAGPGRDLLRAGPLGCCSSVHLNGRIPNCSGREAAGFPRLFATSGMRNVGRQGGKLRTQRPYVSKSGCELSRFARICMRFRDQLNREK